MRIEVLSDHSGRQLHLTRQRLHAAEDEAAARRNHYRQAHQWHETARRARPLWRRLLALPTTEERHALARARAAWQEVLRAERTRERLRHRVAQQSAGASAEEALSRALAGLPDEWVMLRGYRNRRGEADHVLVGPGGVWAVEVKRLRVRLHADADRWWYEKVDRYGHVVETGLAVDGGGRSWGRQVTDVADALAGWLARNGHHPPVSTAVVLMHERAQLGRCANPAVDLLTCHPARLRRAIEAAPPHLTAGDCRDIVRLLRRDHRYHANPRRR